MKNTLRWLDDPSSNVIEVGTDTFFIADSYSQWILEYGADFDLSEELVAEDENDFKFIGIYRSLADDSDIGTSDINISLFNFKIIRTTPATTTPVVFIARLPLRARSVVDDATPVGIPLELEFDGCDPAKMAIVGIIDDSINIAQERFRDQNGNSRVDYAWIQEGDKMSGPSVQFGRELAKPEINAAIAKYGDDDDSIMLDLELIGKPQGPYRASPLRLNTSHGTHVCDLAAGYDPDESNINRRLITVQLPTLASQDTSGAALIASVLEAARFIFKRALTISRTVKYPVPVLINFSYAFHGGPRTGLSILERTLRALAAEYKAETEKIVIPPKKKPSGKSAPVELVLPAGNAHLTRTHADYENTSNGTATGTLDLPLRIQPDDKTSSFLEIWFPNTTPKISIDIEQPDGSTGTIEFDTTQFPQKAKVLARPKRKNKIKPVKKTIIARVSLDAPSDIPIDDLPYWRVLIAFAPTTPVKAKRRAAQHGVWKIKASGELKPCQKIQAWIQRDESVSGLGTRGRQAYFDDAAYEQTRFDPISDITVSDVFPPSSVVQRNGSLSGIATNLPGTTSDQKIVVVGANRWDTGAAAIYSSAGSNSIEGPLVMCTSDTSRVLPGVLAAGTRCGSTSVQNGTSVTAPQVVRCLADVIEETPLSCRPGFDSHGILSGLVKEPPRPPNDGLELAYTNVIRCERVKYGLLPVDDDDFLAKNIIRGVEPKF